MIYLLTETGEIDPAEMSAYYEKVTGVLSSLININPYKLQLYNIIMNVSPFGIFIYVLIKTFVYV